MVASEANEPGSESGKRSDDRRGVPEGTPQEGGASTPLAAPGSFAAAAMVTRAASLVDKGGRARHDRRVRALDAELAALEDAGLRRRLRPLESASDAA